MNGSFSASRLPDIFPIIRWIRSYNLEFFVRDIIATAIVFALMVPQALAYAMSAGLPPETGLYACMLPAFIYAMLGSSMMLSVGPTALIALMTSTAAHHVAIPGSPEYLGVAIVLALLTGIFLFIMGVLRLGFLTNFLSRPVISGFMTGCALLIAAKQVKHLLGIAGDGETMPEIISKLAPHFSEINPATTALTVGILAATILFDLYFKKFFLLLGVKEKPASLLARTAPMFVVAGSILAVYAFDLNVHSVKLVGALPPGLPAFTMPELNLTLWSQVAGSAFLIALLGFVESVSIAQAYAARRKERVNPNQELVALGLTSIASSFSGGCPVTGSFSRSAVNFHAGAATPLVGPYKAIGIAIVVCFFTPILSLLPMAVLAVIIIRAVIPLIDFKALGRAWIYSKREFFAILVTVSVTLIFGVEPGLLTGVAFSLLSQLYLTSKPDFAVVGLVPGTQHFREETVSGVVTSKSVIFLRIDEGLYFANAGFLEDLIYSLVSEKPDVKHFVLMCSAVNQIDMSALDSLETINQRLNAIGITLHLSEVKEPIMRRLKRTAFLQTLSGRVFETQYAALKHLDPQTIERAEGLRGGTGPSFF